jgi:hypothetical protein
MHGETTYGSKPKVPAFFLLQDPENDQYTLQSDHPYRNNKTKDSPKIQDTSESNFPIAGGGRLPRA